MLIAIAIRESVAGGQSAAVNSGDADEDIKRLSCRGKAHGGDSDDPIYTTGPGR
jgi:hypothetical protein